MKYYEDKKKVTWRVLKKTSGFQWFIAESKKKHEYVRNRDKCDWIATTMECPMQYGATD